MDNKCNGNCDKETCACSKDNTKMFDKIFKIFETNTSQGEIVIISFGVNFDKHVIGKIYNIYSDKVILLYDVFEIVPDKNNSDERSNLISYARGTVGDAVSIPPPFTCGIPSCDVVENYKNVLIQRKKMFEELEKEKLPQQNVFDGNTTLQ